jgi:hypothetical protein
MDQKRQKSLSQTITLTENIESEQTQKNGEGNTDGARGPKEQPF